MSARRHFYLALVLLFATFGQAFAQSSTEARVEKLEEAIRLLERREVTLEDQLRQKIASPSVPPEKFGWRKLQRGMSEADVERLLGSPTKVEASIAFTLWHYGEPYGAQVQFDARSRTVFGWREP